MANVIYIEHKAYRSHNIRIHTLHMRHHIFLHITLVMSLLTLFWFEIIQIHLNGKQYNNGLRLGMVHLGVYA